MQPQFSSITETQRFMCLEDRLLQALYKSEGPVTLQHLAGPISITPSAALSIAHRIKKAYPEYLLLEEEDRIEKCYLNAIPSQVPVVQQFLHKGGFTRINEQEFLYYYEKELKRERRQALVQLYKEKMKREKWVIGISSLVGMGIIIATYLHKRMRSQ